MEIVESEREDNSMSNIVEAKYQIVQDRTLPVIISEIKIIEQTVAKTAMEGAIQIGERLQEAKEQVGHGNFEQWCEENLNYSSRTARNFMRIASEYGGENGLISNRKMSSDLSISNALSLLKVPEEDREKFIEEHPVEDMKNKDLEDEIRKLKEEKESRERTVNVLNKSLQDEAEKLSEAYHEIEDLKRQLDETPEETVDPAELEKMEKKLQKAEASLEKAKEKLKQEQKSRQAAIDKELQAQRDEMAAKTQKSIDSLQAEIEQLKKREQNAGNESMLKFKVLVDQLQDTFRQAGECIVNETDQEMADKMNAALRTILKNMEDDL